MAKVGGGGSSAWAHGMVVIGVRECGGEGM